MKNLRGFIFGGFSSRFWMLRKHINSMPRQQLTKLPFYCWECLTIETMHRQLELVIKDEEDMNSLIKYLIFTLRTIDGTRDSANELIKRFNKREQMQMSTRVDQSVFLQLSMQQSTGSRLSFKKEKKPQPTFDDNQFFTICKKTFFKYQMIRIRSKLSFVALQKCMTIKELFMFGILKAY